MRAIDYQKELNSEQLDAVLHGDGACLVLAGAGSGKTRTVTYRVARLLEMGAVPSSILLLTFTNKAAREMLDRIGILTGAEAKGIWGGTFHAVANRLLRTFAPALGYTSSFSILDEEDAQSLMKSVLKDARIDTKTRRFPSPSVIKNVHSFARNTGQSFSDALEIKHPNFLDCASEAEEVVRGYTDRKRQANSMDFDDLLGNWLLLMEQRPDVAQMISSRFVHVLVDEFQDTNILQARLVQAVSRAHGNVFAVGDDAQSIYSFRGADVQNILNFGKAWPSSKVFKLLSNYRSTPQILDLANASLQNNENQYQKDLIGLKEKGPKPLLVAASSARQEAEFVADQVLRLRSEGVALANIAVLFRAASHSQALEFEFMKRDIPYEYRGGTRFFERAHIKDVLAYLRLKVNAKEETAWLRVLNMQPGIGGASASQIIVGIKMLGDGNSDLNMVASPSRAMEGWKTVKEMLKAISEQAATPAAAIRVVTAAQPYRLYLEAEYPDWKERLEDLEQLAVFAEGYADIAAFLADATLDDAAFGRKGASGYDEERTVLSTVHQAKGLEWDTVFVVHLTDIGFPSPRAVEEDNIEEERRLFYVAVTRARQRLYLTYPQTVGMENLRFCMPSLFIEELPGHLIENMQTVRQVDKFGGFGRRHDGDSDLGVDGFYDDDVIELDSRGDRRGSDKPKSVSVWKQPIKKTTTGRISILREVDEL